MKRAFMMVMALAGCSSSQSFDYKTSVKQQLRDPASAEFSDVTVGPESACGFVNSKNGFGGYAGKMPFIAIAGDVVFIEGPSDRELMSARCLEPAKSKIDAWITEKVISTAEVSNQVNGDR